MLNENKTIAETIKLLEQGQYRERKEYLQQIQQYGYCKAFGFTFVQEIYCWIVWKDKEDEEIFKVVPRTRLSTEQICNILSNQLWVRP